MNVPFNAGEKLKICQVAYHSGVSASVLESSRNMWSFIGELLFIGFCSLVHSVLLTVFNRSLSDLCGQKKKKTKSILILTPLPPLIPWIPDPIGLCI